MSIKQGLKEKKDILEVKAKNKISQASEALDEISDRSFQLKEKARKNIAKETKRYPLVALGVASAVGFSLALLFF